MNKEIKIIDLLNKISNENYKPLQVKWRSATYYYMAEYDKYKNDKNDRIGLFGGYTIEEILNDTVEIIEEDNNKIEKMKIAEVEDTEHLKFKEKINEIIDYLKSKGE